VAEVRVACARGQDEVVVGNVAKPATHFLDGDRPSDDVDARDVGEQHGRIPLCAQQVSDRRRDVARAERRRRYLIEERLKRVVIVSIDHSDVDGGARERPRSGKPAESASDDHHVRSMPSGRRHEHRVTG